jgi:hypothetical protein
MNEDIKAAMTELTQVVSDDQPILTDIASGSILLVSNSLSWTLGRFSLNATRYLANWEVFGMATRTSGHPADLPFGLSLYESENRLALRIYSWDWNVSTNDPRVHIINSHTSGELFLRVSGRIASTQGAWSISPGAALYVRDLS